MRDQSGTLAIRARQPAVPAVDPVFVVIAQAREGVVNAEPKRAFNRTKITECAAGVRGWRRLDPRWQSDRWGRRHTNVRGEGGGGGALAEIHGAGTRLLLRYSSSSEDDPQPRLPRREPVSAAAEAVGAAPSGPMVVTGRNPVGGEAPAPP